MHVDNIIYFLTLYNSKKLTQVSYQERKFCLNLYHTCDIHVLSNIVLRIRDIPFQITFNTRLLRD